MRGRCLLATGLLAASLWTSTVHVLGELLTPVERLLIQGVQVKSPQEMLSLPWELHTVALLTLELCDFAPFPASSIRLPPATQAPTLEAFIKFYCGITCFVVINLLRLEGN